jgi:hypothetical protein
LRIQYAGARYHLMSRGDRREPIFSDDKALTLVSPLDAAAFCGSPLIAGKFSSLQNIWALRPPVSVEVSMKKRGRPEYARPNTGARITRGNSATGALPIRRPEDSENKK